MNFHNSSRLDSGSEDVLFCWLILLGSKSVQIVKETRKFGNLSLWDKEDWQERLNLVSSTTQFYFRLEIGWLNLDCWFLGIVRDYWEKQEKLETHYLALSLSWYSLDLEKHSWTPASTQSLFIPANNSSENGSVSSILDTTSITILASLSRSL